MEFEPSCPVGLHGATLLGVRPRLCASTTAMGSQLLEEDGFPFSGFFRTPSLMCANLYLDPYVQFPVFSNCVHTRVPSGVRLCPPVPVVSTVLGLADLLPERVGLDRGGPSWLLPVSLWSCCPVRAAGEASLSCHLRSIGAPGPVFRAPIPSGSCRGETRSFAWAPSL